MYMPLLLVILSLFSSLLSAAPLNSTLIARTGSITFESCSALQQTLISSYLRDMQKLAKAGADATEVAPGHETAEYKAWWGYEPAKGLINERINTRFEKLSNFIANPRKEVIFNCGKNTGCTGTSPAGTDMHSTRIYLCSPSFWKMPMTKLSGMANPARKCTDIGLYRGRANVLLHELTHALFFTKDEELADGGKGSGYGHANALRLAKENPAAARQNADSYAMFATGAYFGGIENWETNPSKICDE